MDDFIEVKLLHKYDTKANWDAHPDHVLEPGETGIEHDAETGKVRAKTGDGTTPWGELPYDDAFSSDLIITKQFGKYAPGDTVPSKGKNAEELFADAFSEDVNPETTAPSITLADVSEFKSYEVGTKVSPSYTINFDPGKYTYGPATGVTETGYSASFNGETLTTKSGEFAELTVADDTNMRMSASATYGDGAIPETMKGAEYAAGQIKGGTTETKYSGYIKGYRNSFYGTYDAKTDDQGVATGSTSASIRTLTASGKALANGGKFDVTIPVGALRVVIAYPATLRDLTSIQDNNDSMSNIVSSFTKTTVSVEGANGATAIAYKVYTMDFANPYDTANKYSVTI